MHSFNFIALSAFIKTHLSQREREKTRRGERKSSDELGGGQMESESGKGGERYKQSERDVQTKRGDFPEVLDKRICYCEEGQVLRVVLMEGGEWEGWAAITLGRGSYTWTGGKEEWEGLRGSAGVINDESGV